MQALELFRVAAKLVVDKGDFDKDMQEADKGGKSFAENLSGYMNKAKNVITGIMGAIAIKEIVSGIWNLAKETAAAGDRIDKTSQALGFSRKAFQEWDYILAQNGASIDSLGASMRTLQAAISANSGETAAALSQLGLSAAHLQSISPEEQFEEIVRALQKLPDGAKKSQLAMQLLGRNAQSLMPLLNQSAESTEELRQRAHDLGLVMSDDDVDASVAFGDALDDLTKTFNAFKQRIGAQLLPTLTKGISGLTDFVAKIRKAYDAKGIVGVFESLITDFKKIKWPTWEDVRNAIINGWNSIIKGVESLGKVIFGENVDGTVKWPTWEDIGNAIVNAWNAIVAGVKDLGKIIFGENVNGEIDWPTWEEIGDVITTAWTNIVNGVSALGETVGKAIFGENVDGEIDWPTWDEIGSAITTAWNSIVDGVKSLAKVIFGENVDGSINWPKWEDIEKSFSVWWYGEGGILEKIEDATKWVLGLFGLPEVDAASLSQDVGAWFSGIVDTIVDACGWVLGLFGLPTDVNKEMLAEDVTTWFAGFSSVLIDSCNWVLKLFGLPEVNTEELKNDVWDWFSSFSSIIVNACSWVLSMFGLPTDFDKDQLKSDVSLWFSSLSGILIEACNWVLNLFGLPTVDTESLKKSVSDWFGGFSQTLIDVCSWTLGLFGLPTDVDLQTLSEDVSRWFSGYRDTLVAACDWVLGVFGLPSVSDIVEKVSNWWNGNGEDDSGVKGLVMAAMDAVLFTIGLPSAAKIKQDIIDWWNGIVESIHLGISAFFDGIFGSPQTNTNTSEPTNRPDWYRTPRKVNVGTTTNPDDALNDLLNDGWFWGSRAQGLNYVPYDGYALVHRGETILNQDQSREHRANNGINAQELYNAVASAVEAAVSNIQINMDGKQVGNAVTDQVSRNIYRAQYGRRFTFA